MRLKPLAIAAMLLSMGSFAHAGTINCGDSYRTASLGSASACFTQVLGSTAKASDLNSIAGGGWSKVSELTSSGTDGWFSVSGSGWGKSNASGSWSISSLFWDSFSSALITMHVGGGNKSAVDNFEWLVTPKTLSGDWLYNLVSGKGGGLSNIKLWGVKASSSSSSSSSVASSAASSAISSSQTSSASSVASSNVSSQASSAASVESSVASSAANSSVASSVASSEASSQASSAASVQSSVASSEAISSAASSQASSAASSTPLPDPFPTPDPLPTPDPHPHSTVAEPSSFILAVFALFGLIMVRRKRSS